MYHEKADTAQNLAVSGFSSSQRLDLVSGYLGTRPLLSAFGFPLEFGYRRLLIFGEFLFVIALGSVGLLRIRSAHSCLCHHPFLLLAIMTRTPHPHAQKASKNIDKLPGKMV